MKRTEALGEALRQRKLETAICHADIHTANLLVDGQDKLFVVDWDGVCLAPRERDLMFVVEDASLETGPCHPQQAWFFEGYGAVPIDRKALAYYRGEWAVQEIGDFGGRVFHAKQGGDLTRMDSVQGFKQLFEPGDVMEAAYKEA